MTVTTVHLTSNGTPITPGLRVFTNNYRWGTVDPAQFTRSGVLAPGGRYFDGWYDVIEDGHGRTIMNGERMTTRAPHGAPADPHPAPTPAPRSAPVAPAALSALPARVQEILAARRAPAPRPVVVRIDWTHREGNRVTGVMTVDGLTPAEEAAAADAGRTPQALVTTGRRCRTLDAVSDYGTDTWQVGRVSVDKAAASFLAWLGVDTDGREVSAEVHWEDAAL